MHVSLFFHMDIGTELFVFIDQHAALRLSCVDSLLRADSSAAVAVL